MKRKSNILKIIAWTIIGLWLTRSLLFRLFHFDFASSEIEQNFRQIWLALIPIAIGILVVKSWKQKNLMTKRIIGLVLSTILSFGLVFILNFFSCICVREFSEPLYKHRTKDMEVKFRMLNCGATDGNPTNDLVVTYNLGPYLTKYSKISKDEINEIEWLKKMN